MGFMMMDFKVCSARINLNGILKDEEGSGPISIKLTDRLNEIEISKVFCCYALLLCANKDNTRLLVWNPYLGQTKWIEPKKAYHRLDSNSYFLAVDKIIPLLRGSFFIDEEKKLALAFTLDTLGRYKRAYIIGWDEYFKQVDLGEAVVVNSDEDPLFPTRVLLQVPSLVQINQVLVVSGKRKEQ
ncbi:hypothetical protein Bca101_080674 [Brassica carinata]